MKQFSVFLLVASLLLSLAGCSSGMRTALDSKAFKSAPPEVKTLWDKAVEAIKIKDYSTGLVNLNQLAQKPTLSSEQTQAVQELMRETNEKLYAAAEAGDAKAKQFIEDMKKMRTR